MVSQNGQTHFKNLAANAVRFFKTKASPIILGHYVLKGLSSHFLLSVRPVISLVHKSRKIIRLREVI